MVTLGTRWNHTKKRIKRSKDTFHLSHIRYPRTIDNKKILQFSIKGKSIASDSLSSTCHVFTWIRGGEGGGEKRVTKLICKLARFSLRVKKKKKRIAPIILRYLCLRLIKMFIYISQHSSAFIVWRREEEESRKKKRTRYSPPICDYIVCSVFLSSQDPIDHRCSTLITGARRLL